MADMDEEDGEQYYQDRDTDEGSFSRRDQADDENGYDEGNDDDEASPDQKLNWDGFDHVRQMQEQNRELLLKLEEERKKVKKLKDELSCFQIVGRDDSTDIREKKLIELAKKNRNLNLALEREKLNNAKLQAEVKKMKENMPALTTTEDALQDGQPIKSEREAKDPVGELDAKLKETKEKLSQVTAKLMDTRAQNEYLKVELSKTQRALQREIGDDVPLTKALDEGSNWKGRAQQISLLKSKVAELKQALGISGNASIAPSAYAPSEMGSIRPQSARTTATFDERHKEVIDAKAKNSRLEVDKLTADLMAKTEESTQLKMKYEASQARIKTLESETRSLKSKIQILIEKTETDDQLIDMLKQEIERRKTNLSANAVKQKPEKGSHPQVSDEAAKRRVKEQDLQIERQEQIILALRNELQSGRAGNSVRMHQISDSDRALLMESQLKIENERLKELVQVYKKKLNET